MEEPGDLWWLIGVVFVILGSLGQNFGNNLASFAHAQFSKFMEQTEGGEVEKGNSWKEPIKQEPRRNSSSSSSSSTLSVNVAKDGGVWDCPPTSGEKDVSSAPSARDVISAPSARSRESALVAKRKQATTLIFSRPTEKKAAVLRRRVLWGIGTLSFVLGSLLTFAAFGFAAQSLLASLESIQFVSNIFFARFVHKEVIRKQMVIATFFIVLGNVLVVVFSGKETAPMPSDSIVRLYLTNTAYHYYLAVVLGLVVINETVYQRYRYVRLYQKRKLFMHSTFEPLTYAIASAIIGTQAVLNSKCMSMLLQFTARGSNELVKPTIYVICGTWIIFVAFWLRRLDKGLELFPPLFIIPVMQVFFVFFAIMCGGIFFQEFIEFTMQQYIGFAVGVVMILGGVFGLAPTDINVIKVADQASVISQAESEMPAVQSANAEREPEGEPDNYINYPQQPLTEYPGVVGYAGHSSDNLASLVSGTPKNNIIPPNSDLEVCDASSASSHAMTVTCLQMPVDVLNVAEPSQPKQDLATTLS